MFPNMTNSSDETTIIEFEDFSDLQTRLVLLPLVEEEGIGATVASYFPSDERYSFHDGDGSDLAGYVLLNIIQEGCQVDRVVASEDGSICRNLNIDGRKDLTDIEFSAILALIRAAPSPIALSFVRSLKSNNIDRPIHQTSNRTHDNISKVTPYYDRDEEEKKVEVDYNDLNQSEQAATQSTSSFWTTRFMGEASLQQLASGAATSAANLARAANERASKLAAAASTTKSVSSISSTCASTSKENLCYAIYKQCVQTGEFLQIQQQKIEGCSTLDPVNAHVDNSVVTNTSLLAIRCSSALACPKVPGQSFQWYRSSARTPTSGFDHERDDQFDNNGWHMLQGAEQAVFQPSATEVGYRLKCVISIVQTENSTESTDDCSDDSTASSVGSLTLQNKEDDSIHEHAKKLKSNTIKMITCEVLSVVSADSSLFNGARQALGRGFQFSGIAGIGNAEGRNFTLRIHIARRKHASIDQSKKIVCALTIYQVSSGVSEPIHPEDSPMICVSAISDAGHAKQFELILAAQCSAATMVSALSLPYYDDVDDNSIGSHHNQSSDSLLMRLQLQAPNRLARESLLLAIGVANYSGKPIDLNESVILFQNEKMPSIPSSWSIASNASSNSLWALTEFDSESVIEDDEEVAKLSNSSLHESNATANATTLVDSDSAGVDQRLQASVSLDMSVLIKEGDVELPLNAEQELLLLREKLTRKDKIISELQRSVAQSDEETRITKSRLDECQEENSRRIEEKQTIECTLQKTLLKLTRQQNDFDQLSQSHQLQENQLQKIIDEKTVKTNESEKANRALHNDIAVLSAAIEARENKLTKMAEIKASLEAATVRLSQNESIEQDLIECEKRLVVAKDDCERMRKLECERTLELESAKKRIIEFEEKLKIETAKASGHQSQLEKEQMKVQKLKAERNSYKQKGDSLAKEISRVCRNGRSIRDIEKIISDDIARRQEVELLRQQKQSALDEAQNNRILLEQSRMTQKLMSNSNGSLESSSSKNVVKLLHRNEELERLLSELTEYVTAKEMQLDTMKQINDSLQLEIRDLAKANMSKNDV